MMRRNYRDRSRSRCKPLPLFIPLLIFPARSRSREKDERSYHKFASRDTHRNMIKLHVGNLPLHANEEMVQMQFEKFINIKFQALTKIF